RVQLRRARLRAVRFRSFGQPGARSPDEPTRLAEGELYAATRSGERSKSCGARQALRGGSSRTLRGVGRGSIQVCRREGRALELCTSPVRIALEEAPDDPLAIVLARRDT